MPHLKIEKIFFPSCLNKKGCSYMSFNFDSPEETCPTIPRPLPSFDLFPQSGNETVGRSSKKCEINKALLPTAGMPSGTPAIPQKTKTHSEEHYFVGYVKKLDAESGTLQLWDENHNKISRVFTRKFLSHKGIVEEGQAVDLLISTDSAGDLKLSINVAGTAVFRTIQMVNLDYSRFKNVNE